MICGSLFALKKLIVCLKKKDASSKKTISHKNHFFLSNFF